MSEPDNKGVERDNLSIPAMAKSGTVETVPEGVERLDLEGRVGEFVQRNREHGVFQVFNYCGLTMDDLEALLAELHRVREELAREKVLSTENGRLAQDFYGDRAESLAEVARLTAALRETDAEVLTGVSHERLLVIARAWLGQSKSSDGDALASWVIERLERENRVLATPDSVAEEAR